ncbi:MAG: HYR domain-containing protein [Verrucomicrobiota bacterium]
MKTKILPLLIALTLPARLLGDNITVTITVDNGYGFGFGDVNGIYAGQYYGGIDNCTAAQVFGSPCYVFVPPDGTVKDTGPEIYYVTASSSDYIYIVAWSDDSVYQGAVASFTDIGTGQTVTTSPNSKWPWQVFATGTNWAPNCTGSGQHGPLLAEINDAITTANASAGGPGSSVGWVGNNGWAGSTAVAPTGSLINGRLDFSGQFNGNTYPIAVPSCIGSGALWMEYNPEPTNSSCNPFVWGSTSDYSSIPNFLREYLIYRIGPLLPIISTNTCTNACISLACPNDIVVTSCVPTQVFYTPTATDTCSNCTVTVVCNPLSGSTFSPGTTTTVSCTATDSCTNSCNCSFTVTVLCPNSPCCPDTNGVKYVQNPDLSTNGIDVNATFYPVYGGAWVLADDFPCTNSGPITDIHLWGSWLNDQVDYNAVFTLAIWSDFPSPFGPYTSPGQLLWSQTYSNGQYTLCPYTNQFEKFGACAPVADVFGSSSNLFYLCFDASPANTFYQTGTPAAETVYWLSVTVQSLAGSNYFGWKSSATGYNEGAVAASLGNLYPQPGDWQQIFDLQGEPLHLAFKITTATIPPCCPDTNGVKYVQDPDLTNGVDLNATFSPPDPADGVSWVLADDFPCTNSGPITDIHLWGSWLYDQVDYSAIYTLAIWSDVPTTRGGYSHPGQLLWAETYTNGEYTLCPYINQFENFYDGDYAVFFGLQSWLGSSTNLDYLCFDVSPTNAFYQTGTLTAPTNYWLSVTVQSFTGSNYFGWKSSATAYNDAAVAAFEGSFYPQPGDWYPMDDNQGAPYNLAFKITTATNCVGTLTLLCSNLTITCGSPIPTNPPAWIDLCCSNVTVTLLGSTTTNSGCTETISQTWQAVDQCYGITNTCVQVVTVLDTTPPVITCSSNKTVNCGTNWSFNTPSAHDACTGTAHDACTGTNVLVSVQSAFTNGLCPQVATCVWIAYNVCTNASATCTQVVTVLDTTPPVITCSSNKTVNCGTNWSFNTGVLHGNRQQPLLHERASSVYSDQWQLLRPEHDELGDVLCDGLLQQHRLVQLSRDGGMGDQLLLSLPLQHSG